MEDLYDQNGTYIGKKMVCILPSAISSGQDTFVIPDGIVQLTDFYPIDIKEVETIEIPASVENLNFGGMHPNVLVVNIHPENTEYCSENGSVYSKDKKTFCFYSVGTDKSKDLEEINVEEGITTIARGCFRKCENVKKINFPQSLTTLESEAVSNRKKLQEVNIKENVSNIAPLAFYNCSILETINIDSSNPYYMVEGQGIYNKDKTILVGTFGEIIGTFEVPYGVEVLGGISIHYQRKITSIILPETLKEIGETFRGCSGLTSIRIPNSVNKINVYAFSGTDNLSEIIIDNYHFTDSSKKTPTISGEPWGCKYGARAITWLRGEHP